MIIPSEFNCNLFSHPFSGRGVQEVVDVEVEMVLADQEDVFSQRICGQSQDLHWSGLRPRTKVMAEFFPKVANGLSKMDRYETFFLHFYSIIKTI